MGFLKKSDKWRSAIVHAPIRRVAGLETALPSTPELRVTLLPDEGSYRFLADPFGLWENGKLYVFVEAFDYRTNRGVIDVLVYDDTFRLLERQRVLDEPWHLSYPNVFRHDGDIYMLPEGFKSGRLTLYRAVNFPYEWEAVPEFVFSVAAIDPTPLHHAGKWWLFWTPPLPQPARRRDLHVSRADCLFGPWEDLGLLYSDQAGARAGGTPWHDGADILLPVQDCSTTYGGAIRLMRLSDFSSGRPTARQEAHVAPPSALKGMYPDGMHTLSAAGEITLIDVKCFQPGLPVRFFKLLRGVKRRLKRWL